MKLYIKIVLFSYLSLTSFVSAAELVPLPPISSPTISSPEEQKAPIAPLDTNQMPVAPALEMPQAPVTPDAPVAQTPTSPAAQAPIAPVAPTTPAPAEPTATPNTGSTGKSGNLLDKFSDFKAYTKGDTPKPAETSPQETAPIAPVPPTTAPESPSNVDPAQQPTTLPDPSPVIEAAPNQDGLDLKDPTLFEDQIGEELEVLKDMPLSKSDADRLKRQELRKERIEKIISRNYKIQTLPEEIYNSNYSKENRHLPNPIYSESFAKFAMELLNNPDPNLNSLRALVETASSIDDMTDGNSNQILFHAIVYGLLPETRMLLAKGANPNLANGNRVYPLDVAEYNRDMNIKNALIEMGATQKNTQN